MAKKELFNEEELQALINLVDVMHKADPNENIYKMPVTTSDTLVRLIDNSENLSDENKARLKGNVNKRKKNQKAVEELSKNATDIKKGKRLLRIRDEEEHETKKDGSER